MGKSIWSVNLGGRGRNNRLGWPKMNVGKMTGTSLSGVLPKVRTSRRGGWGGRRKRAWWDV